jgi:hypothetical protein
MIVVQYDRQSGIVTSTSAGILTVEDIRLGTLEIRAALQRARDDFGRALYLVDARQSVVQPQNIMEEVERAGALITHSEDRMAVVIPSALTGMQTRRVFNQSNEATFQSIDQALAWLRSA